MTNLCGPAPRIVFVFKANGPLNFGALNLGVCEMALLIVDLSRGARPGAHLGSLTRAQAVSIEAGSLFRHLRPFAVS